MSKYKVTTSRYDYSVSDNAYTETIVEASRYEIGENYNILTFKDDEENVATFTQWTSVERLKPDSVDYDPNQAVGEDD
jgi:hypothetical protein